MKFIEFDKNKCDNCFKCLRACPTKAISFNKDNRKIMDDICIKCGRCLSKCPQGALTIRNPINAIKSSLKSGQKYAVSIAPSYIGAFDMIGPNQMATGLRKLGFDVIEETAVGAEIVSKNYERILQTNDSINRITSCCPSANYLIEHHYPELIPYMLPVVSPMIAHGKYIKERYGSAYKVAFIGPCLAKMAEAEEMKGAIDTILTFDELDKWLSDEGLVLAKLEETPMDAYGSIRGKAFPMGTSIHMDKDSTNKNYKLVKVNGINQCKNLLDELKAGQIKDHIFEINTCEGSCNNGPDFPKHGHQRFYREKLMSDYVSNQEESNIPTFKITGNEVSVARTFVSRKAQRELPNHESIRRILRQMGKYTPHDELNCGACGYTDCREKAIAVYFGDSDAHECLAYLRGKAENMHSILIDNSPNAVCTIDNKLTIIEHNPTFEDVFNEMNIKVEGLPIYTFMDESLFTEALKNKMNIKGKKIYVKTVQRYFIVNIIYHPDEDVLLSFFTDITNIEEKKKALEKVKKETLIKTQEVIDKQMRVAQEIASLLGETTAETKLSLNSLKDLVLRDQGGEPDEC